MARRVLPSRLALKRRDGSSNAAPLAKVIFTTFFYVSPVQMIPACSRAPRAAAAHIRSPDHLLACLTQSAI